MKKLHCLLFGTMIGIASATTSCNGPDHRLEINDLLNTESFYLTPPAGTYKLALIVISESTNSFFLQINGDDSFSARFEVEGKGRFTVYNNDWYESPLSIKYEGNHQVKGAVNIEVKFYH